MQVKFSPVFGFAQPSSWAEFLSDSLGKSYFCLSVSGEKAVQYRSDFRTLITKANISSSLELHQVCEEAVNAAEKADVMIEIVAGFFDFEAHRCSVCTYQGEVLLKRAGKVGRILESQDKLSIIEGKLQLDDVFVFVAKSALSAVPVIDRILPSAKNVQLIEAESGKTLRSVTSNTQPALVALHISSGDQADPPLTAGQVIADGDQITQEKFASEMKSASEQKTSFLQSTLHFLKMAKTGFGSFFSKDIYVRRQATQRAAKIVVPIMVILVAIFAFTVYQSQKRAQQIQRAQAIIQPFETQLSQIKQTITTNPLQARQQTEDLIVQLDAKIKEEAANKVTAAELQKELEAIKTYYASISGMEEFPALQPFYDLRLVKSDFIANRMDMQQNRLVFLDSGQGKIIALDANSKQWTDIPAAGAAQMKDIELQGSYAYVIGNGLYRLDLADSKNSIQLNENTDLLQDATGMKLYQQYIYVISVAQNNIWRFSPSEDDKNKLSDPIGWLRQPITLDLNDLQSFAIDGDVWIGTKQGKIEKYATGQAEDFAISGLKENFENPITIYTKEDQTNLYVLEPMKERLVILSKTGEFVREIKSPTLSTTTSLVANEETKKAYVLSGALVFQIDL